MPDWRCGACAGVNPSGMRFCGHCGAPGSVGPVQPALDEERRLVTALFADLSGFTELASRIDPEELQEVVDPVLATLSQVIARYEGQVEKFAGDAVLALFGVPVGHEDDVHRALLTAHEMHRALAQLLPQLPSTAARLALHVGVETGHVVARLVGSDLRLDYGVLGDCVVRAQRLEAAAPAGATYLGETTWRHASGRIRASRVAPVAAKGFAEPLPAWRLDAVGSVRVDDGDALHGRVAELEVGRRLLRQLDGPGPAALTVVGEPGSGKSRLLQALREDALEEGTSWYQARALPYQRAVPYALLLALVRDLLGIDDDAGPGDWRAALTDLGLPALEADGGPHPFEVLLSAAPAVARDPEVFRQQLVAATTALLSARTRTPAVAALDDVHCADDSSHDVLVRALADVGDVPLLLLSSTRDPADASAWATPSAERALTVTVGPLGRTDVRSLVRSVLRTAGGQDAVVAPEVVELLMDRTAGNVLFVRELARSLLDGERLQVRDGTWQLVTLATVDVVPGTVDAVVSARLDTLSPAARQVLQRAAVIGRDVAEELLRAVSDDVCGLEELERAGVLEDCGTSWRFPQAVTHEVAYARLLRRHRRALHQQVGEAAEALFGDSDVDLLARHFALGARGARALSANWKAAQRALRLYANTEAEALLDTAAQLARENPGADPPLADVLLATAELADMRGRYEAGFEHFLAVLSERPDAAAWSGAAASLRKRGEHERAYDLLRQGERVLPASELGPLLLERGRVRLDTGDVPAAIADFEAALAVLPHDERSFALGNVHLAGALLLGGRLEAAAAAGETAHRLFEQRGDLPGLALTMRVLGGVLEDLGRLEEAAQALRSGIALAERLGHVEEVGGCLVNLGLLLLSLGDLDEAVRCDEQALEHFVRVGHVLGQVTAACNLAEKLGRAGRVDEALSWCDRAERGALELGDRLALADLVRTRAQLLLAQGHREQAVSHAARSAELFDEIGAGAEADDARALLRRARGGAG